MYVVKMQQLYPEGDPLPFRWPDGHPALFQTQQEAQQLAMDLMADPKHRGFRFLVEPQSTASPEDLSAADARSFLV